MIAAQVTTAVNGKNIQGVTALLAMGRDPNAQTEQGGWTPLWVAACRRLLEISRLLLQAGADVNIVNRKGVSPLKEAAQIGAAELVRLLLEHGASIDVAAHEFHDTPLIAASAKDYIEVVKILLAAGANARAQQTGGWSSLHYALLNKNKHMATVILAHNPDVNAATITGVRPLHLAVMAGFTSTCEQLLDLGAGIDIMDNGSLTALRVAVQEDQFEIVKLLIDRGSRTDVAGTEGYSLAEVALMSGHVRIYEYLEERERIS